MQNIVKSLMTQGLIVALVSVLSAAGQAGEIRDDAGLFSKSAIERAEAKLHALRKETGKEVRIETFKTVPEGRSDEVAKMKKEDRARFFEKWTESEASKQHVKGIYILITRQPGHLEVAVDRATRTQGFTAKNRLELRDRFLSGFKGEKFDDGLTAGVNFASDTLHALHQATAKGKSPVGVQRDHRTVGHQAPAAGGGTNWLFWILVIGAVFIGIRVLGGLFGGMMGHGPGYGGGYGGPMYGGGGGGFFGSLLTGMLGAVAGNYLYDSFFRGSNAFGGTTGGTDGGADTFGHGDDGAGEDFQTSGGDFGNDDFGGGGFGGGDFGGGDFGGGDFGGGDFGGGGDF
ncbi:MAG: TPM domain-containing protein [Planctomycetes bacterium]|nr:TPM domain-containing protein [Planctomycetota bacterium]